MQKIRRYLIVLFLSGALISFFPFATTRAAQPTTPALPQVVIINQVRGTECCDPGNLTALQKQIRTTEELQLPTHFNLRYDALTNTSMTGTLKSALKRTPNILQIGILVEITPSLAQIAGVPYKASEKDWYEAQNVFTLGYTQPEREKLIDTLFAQFHSVFGVYPTQTTGWIIDTPTLNYIHTKYGVTTHQLTREQFGVDSYTLTGGPPHYPYPASTTWAFMPDYDQKDPLWIVRQTVTDPLGNYGDPSSSFTSQPNDYARAQRPFEYFTKLIDQALFEQPGQQGFALVGLENSMNDTFQTAYAAQLAYIAELARAGRASIVFAQTAATSRAQQLVTVYGGHNVISGDTNSSSYFITTPRYRVRLRIENAAVFISDIRVYTATAIDYYSTQSAVKHSYWIAPFLLDASRSPLAEKTTPSLLARLFGPPTVETPQLEPHQDLTQTTSRFVFPNKNGVPVQISSDAEEAVITVQTEAGVPYTLTFSPEKITTTGLTESPEYKELATNTFPVQYEKKGNGFVLSYTGNPTPVLTASCQKNICEWQFSAPTPQTVTQLQSEWYPFFLPESKSRPLSSEKTVLYAHNRFALAGRNPTRLVLFPFDAYGFPALHDTITVTTEPHLAYSSVESDGGRSTTQFIDLVNPDPIKSHVTVTVNGSITKELTVYFAPNCKETPGYCIKHPIQAFWYIRTILADKFRSLVFKEQQ